MKLFMFVFAVGCVASSAFAEENLATVEGSSTRISLKRHDSRLFLNAEETAKAFGWIAKVVKLPKQEGENGLLTLCRDEQGGLCIPIRLGKVKFLNDSDSLFVEATALAKALRFEAVDKDGKVTLRLLAKRDSSDLDIPAYNADWGQGRGFQAGQTLPDIPLYDLNGRETRFSQFLGKQYILYCWASW
ncbi:MAG: hypothetical protein IH899_12470 [Planctomycetes bacterium]|nr:hypothetical protein [Planctomycetota bacterium]